MPTLKIRTMSRNRDFEIPFAGLKEGVHTFNYKIDDQFFEAFSEPDFCECAAEVKLTLDRKSGFLMLHFDVGGSAKVNCDKCGNLIKKELWDEFNMIIKIVEDPEKMNEEETDPDIFYIGKNESHIDIENWIYEFVTLSIPMQRVCDQIGGPECNLEVLKKLKTMEDNAPTSSTSEIWKGLEKFRNN